MVPGTRHRLFDPSDNSRIWRVHGITHSEVNHISTFDTKLAISPVDNHKHIRRQPIGSIGDVSYFRRDHCPSQQMIPAVLIPKSNVVYQLSTQLDQIRRPQRLRNLVAGFCQSVQPPAEWKYPGCWQRLGCFIH